jgi:hypothetical protein
VEPDGRQRTYNVDMIADGNWAGDILLLGLAPAPRGELSLDRVRMADTPQGPPRIEVLFAGLEE